MKLPGLVLSALIAPSRRPKWAQGVSKYWGNALLGVALLAGLPATEAQTFNIDWATIDGGGGTSSGGIFSVSGTIGQPDAGSMTGGSYSLLGGFWSVLEVVQTTNGPVLSARLVAPDSVIISWPSSASDFELQQTSDLGAANWVKVAGTPATVGSEKQVVISIGNGQSFYRLRKP